MMVPNLPTPAPPPSLTGSTGTPVNAPTSVAKSGIAGARGQFDAALRMFSGEAALPAVTRPGLATGAPATLPLGHGVPRLTGSSADQTLGRTTTPMIGARSPGATPEATPGTTSAAKPGAVKSDQAWPKDGSGSADLRAASIDPGSAITALESGSIKPGGGHLGSRNPQGTQAPVRKSSEKSGGKGTGSLNATAGVVPALTTAPLAMALPVPVAVTLPPTAEQAVIGSVDHAGGSAATSGLGGSVANDGGAMGASVAGQTMRSVLISGAPTTGVNLTATATMAGNIQTNTGVNADGHTGARISTSGGQQAVPAGGQSGSVGSDTRHHALSLSSASFNPASPVAVVSAGTTAIPPAALPVANAPLAHPVSAQVAAALVASGPVQPDGSHHLTIALAPPAIGPVTVAIERAADGTSRIAVSAVDPVTLSALRNDHAGLTEALAQAGITAHEAGISFHLAAGHAADAIAPMMQTAGNGGANSSTGQHRSPGLSLDQGAMGQGLSGQSGGQSGANQSGAGLASEGAPRLAPSAVPVRLNDGVGIGSMTSSSLNLKKFGLDVTA